MLLLIIPRPVVYMKQLSALLFLKPAKRSTQFISDAVVPSLRNTQLVSTNFAFDILKSSFSRY